MFDDPKKELKRLEEELLAAEMSDDEFEQFYDDIYDEFGEEETVVQQDAELKAQLSDRAQNTVFRSVGPYEEDDEARYVSVPKKKSVRGLVILACLESLGIVTIVLWWLLRIL